MQLPNERFVGETDRVVHAARIRAALQGDLATLCGKYLRLENLEQAAVGHGIPCEPCIVTTPDNKAAGGGSADVSVLNPERCGGPKLARSQFYLYLATGRYTINNTQLVRR
jgi:hypothetical protein